MLTTLAALLAASLPAAESPCFAIHVVDEQTGRGVPLIELRTTNEISFWTDSAGYVAFDEPGLMGGEVFFRLKGDGYEYPADGFDIRGLRLVPRPGEEAQIRVKRLNIAERLYRITGQGIYRDSTLLGKPLPIKAGNLNGRVMGQDSNLCAIYHDQLFWLWGDTARPEYPLGNFASSAATSQLPAKGGLPPSVGVDLQYFVDDTGFAKEMARGLGEHLIWLDAFMVLPDPGGAERLVAKFSRLRALDAPIEQGLCVYDDKSQTFQRLATFELDDPSPVGQPFRATTDGVDYFYFPTPCPQLRVPATWDAIHDTRRYEAFTCLTQGTRYSKDAPTLDRDPQGKLVWGWKPDTSYVSSGDLIDLARAGHIKESERWNDSTDSQSGERITLWGGSVAWNAYRQRYIMIAGQGFGKPSFLGEIYYLEADKPEGPWLRGRKIATHAKHSFYNPVHHPFFDEDNGRVIYFEGTYVDTFSDAAIPTPRYNYNQIMYRLDLSDPRLADVHPAPATP